MKIYLIFIKSFVIAIISYNLIVRSSCGIIFNNNYSVLTKRIVWSHEHLENEINFC